MKKILFYLLFLIVLLYAVAARAETHRDGDLKQGIKATKTIFIDGVKRKYILYVPAMAKMPQKGFPVVFVFHGGVGTAVAAQNMSKMHILGSKEGFIVVYPEGLYGGWNTDIISVRASEKGVDDLTFFNRLLDYLIAQYKIDPEMIYVCGISNGGHMSYYLAKKAGERIAALAVVASGLASEQDYLPFIPRPIIVIHGTKDEFIPYKGGQGRRDWYLPVEKTVEHLVKVNRASSKASSYNPYSGFRTTSEIDTFYYEGGPKGEDVVFIRVVGGGHTWPDGGGYIDNILGPTSRAISANQAIWEVFKSHMRKRK